MLARPLAIGLVYCMVRFGGKRHKESVMSQGSDEEEPLSGPARAAPDSSAATPYRAAAQRDPAYTAPTSPETLEQAARHRDFLVAMMPGMVWYCPMNADASLRPPAYMSRYLQRFAGYTPEQWIHTPGFWSSVIHPEDRHQVLAATRRALIDGTPVPPYRLGTSDGRTIWIQSSLQVELAADGRPAYMYGLALDITQYKEAEAKVEESLRRERLLNDRLDALLASVPGVVWERWEGDVEAAFCSEFVEQLSGYTVAQWQAMPHGWLDLTPTVERDAAAASFRAAWESRATVIRQRLQRRDGELRWVEHHVRVVTQPGRARCMRGLALDITEREKADAERERLRLQIDRQSMRIAELSTPLIALNDNVVLLPLIGTIDAERAERLLDALLAGLETTRATVAVIDVTGVSTVDQLSADLLGRAAHAARLLGTRVLITGIRAEMARALVRLGIQLQGVELHSSLQSAIKELLPGAPPAPRSANTHPGKLPLV